MDIEEFTKKFIIEELDKICWNYHRCALCPFYCVSAEHYSNCKLQQLDEDLSAYGEKRIWSK